VSELGPLDIVRDVNDRARELDHIASKRITSEESFEVFRDEVHDLDTYNPLMNQEVVGWGTTLTILADCGEDLGTRLALPPKDKTVKTTGVYIGYCVKLIYDLEFEQLEHRVVHMVRTGKDQYGDEYGNIHTVTKYTYISVVDGEIEPVLPINAHSFKDLEGDDVIKGFNEIVFDDKENRFGKVKRLGYLANRVLVNLDHQTDRNHQRVSYLNSLGLLEGAMILTRDYVKGDKDSLLKGEVSDHSDLSSLMELNPVIFDTAPGYERQRDKIILRETPELYARAVLPNGEPVMAPLKNVVEVFGL
jgi:hypothetical protein